MRTGSPLWQGIFWKVLSCACFAGVNGIVRYLSGGSPTELANPLSTPVIVFFQNLIGAAMMVFVLKQTHQTSLNLFKNPKWPMHSLRIVLAVLGTILWFLSLSQMPIAQVVALSFTGPLLTVFGAVLLLKETLTLQRILAIALSFIGALFIIRPDTKLLSTDLPGIVALLPMAAACVFALTKLATRKLAASGESAETLAAYLLVFMVPISLVPALFQWVSPSFSQIPWLLLMGFFTAMAHYSFSKAYAFAEVTFLMPVGFVKFLLSVSVGYFAFAEIPQSMMVWVGIGIIALSTMTLTYKPNTTPINQG